MGDRMMFSPTPSALAQIGLRCAIGAVVLTLMGAGAQAQGLVKGVQQGAQAGNKAAGPVGGVLGGAIGGVVGVFTGVLGAGNNQPAQQPPAANGSKQSGSTRAASKAAKGEKADKPGRQPAVLTQNGEPALTAEQIVTNSDANIERIKKELELTPEQEKNWSGFNSAMHYLGHNGADRLNLRIARAKRDPPDDIIEQMRNEAQFLDDRAVDQRNVADAAEPLYASLNDKQKQIFIDEMVRLSHERGLD
jgi:outer membrane cobalamin receptor